MALNDREQIHHQLLDALYTARKQVEYLEAALAHNAAYLGTGVEREGQFGVKPEDMVAPDALIRYLELVEPEADISDYIGSEGVDHTRPRLGPDAPDAIRPARQARVDPRVGNVAMGHPDDFLAFPFKAGVLPPGTYLETRDYGEEYGENIAPEQEGTASPPALSIAAPQASAPAPVGPSAASGLAPLQRRDTGPIPLWVENVPVLPAAGSMPSVPFTATGSASGSLIPPEAASGTEKEAHAAGQEQQHETPRPVTDEDGLRAHNALRALDFGLWDWNMRTGNVFISSRWEELLGRPPDGLASAFDTLTSSLHPEDAANLRQSLPGLQRGEAASISMAVRYRKGGQNSGDPWSAGRLYAACSRLGGKAVRLTVVCSEDGAVPCRRYDAETQAFLRRFTSGMEDGFALIERRCDQGADGRERESYTLLFMNTAFRTMYAVGKHGDEELLLASVAGQRFEDWQNALANVMRTRRPARLTLVPGLDQRPYEVSIYSPEPDLAVCIVKDITEAYKLELEAHRNEVRLAALYRLSHMDDEPEDSIIRFCLDEAVRMTGSELGYVYIAPASDNEEGRIYWSPETLVRDSREMAAPSFCNAATDARAACPFPQGPEVVNFIDGSACSAFGDSLAVSRYMLIPVVPDGRMACVAAVANKQGIYEASDQRQLDLFLNGMWFYVRRRRGLRELQRAKKAAEAASQAKNEFLANISHEVRTPLNGILGMLQALQQSSLTREQKEYMHTAMNSGQNLLRTITDILEFARMESVNLELSPRPFDLALTVQSTISDFAHEAERRGIALNCSIAANIPVSLVGDEARVRQVLFNLVGNAIKFTPQGEVRVECLLLPYKKQGRPVIYFAVSDTGIGIPEEKLAMIFQPFTQSDASSTRRYSGAGIGLAIVGHLVQLMDGSISVESELGRGTTMHCTLVFDQAPPVPAPRRRQGAETAVRPLDILTVEDDSVNQFALHTLLKKAGHKALCVHNGRQAIGALRLRPFQCVITDIQMPVMDGEEFVRRIRAGRTDDVAPDSETYGLLGLDATRPEMLLDIPTDEPIVALTAHALTGDKERFLAAGVDYYLTKPLSATELNRVLTAISLKLHANRQQDR